MSHTCHVFIQRFRLLYDLTMQFHLSYIEIKSLKQKTCAYQVVIRVPLDTCLLSPSITWLLTSCTIIQAHNIFFTSHCRSCDINKTCSFLFCIVTMQRSFMIETIFSVLLKLRFLFLSLKAGNFFSFLISS